VLTEAFVTCSASLFLLLRYRSNKLNSIRASL
jgi:hypothetical protein